MTRQLFFCTIFLALTFVVTSCNGQVKKNLPKEKVSETKIISVGQPKLIKTQNSQKADNVNCSLQDKAYDGKTFTSFSE